MSKKKLLIEAISTNSGGAIAHLKNLLLNFDNQSYFDEVDVYLPFQTKKLMPIKKSINYICPSFFSLNLFSRVLWQTLILNIIVIKKKYDCIFVTGSSHFLLRGPVVTISQNLLPFSQNEVEKYFFSFFYIKMKLLKFIQKLSFKMSKGIIFLHKYSQNKILSQINRVKGMINVVAHGVESSKLLPLKNEKKFRVIYVSNIDLYKNQIFIIKALNEFLEKNPNYKNKIFVEFYGAFYKPALTSFNQVLNNIQNKKNFKYFGLKKKEFIYSQKKGYNTIFLFASSCENFSVSLIEGMSRGLPILCVNLQPMKSVLGNNALFYKNNSYKSFHSQLFKIISSHTRRKDLSRRVYNQSKKYNGKIIAKKTFLFLKKVSKKYYER